MEKYKLTKEQYKLLKSLDLEEMEGNEIIACDGMDKEQENCTEYGRKLYDLHDTILYS